GDYTVPPVSFSYFDPAAKAYKTLESDTFSLHVAPNGALAVKPEPGQTDPALLTPSSKWTDVIGLEIIVGAIMILVLLGVIIYLLKRNQVTDPGVPKETIQ